jgi:phosphatidylinositol alpha-mannosyltransferase
VGEVSDSEKAKFYASADIFCTPATGQESFGIVLLEAMASGLPIVASDIEGFSHVVSHGREALLFESRNVKDLENQLTRLIQDSSLRKRLGNNGRISVQSYCWKNITSRLIDYYASLSRLKSETPVSVNVGR